MPHKPRPRRPAKGRRSQLPTKAPPRAPSPPRRRGAGGPGPVLPRDIEARISEPRGPRGTPRTPNYGATQKMPFPRHPLGLARQQATRDSPWRGPIYSTPNITEYVPRPMGSTPYWGETIHERINRNILQQPKKWGRSPAEVANRRVELLGEIEKRYRAELRAEDKQRKVPLKKAIRDWKASSKYSGPAPRRPVLRQAIRTQ